MRRDERSDRRRVIQYVSVVLEMAQQSGSWAIWDSDLQVLNWLASSGRARALLGRSRSTVAERIAALRATAGDLLSEEGFALARVLVEDDLLALVPAIRARYRRRSEQEGHVQRVSVTSAVPLGQREVLEVYRRVELPGRTLLLEFMVDPEIMGGMIVRQGDWRKDLSVTARLRALQVALQ